MLIITRYRLLDIINTTCMVTSKILYLKRVLILFMLESSCLIPLCQVVVGGRGEGGGGEDLVSSVQTT